MTLDPVSEARSHTAASLPRDSYGRFLKNAGTNAPGSTALKFSPFITINKSGQTQATQIESIRHIKKSNPPLLDLKITNPIIYLKAWWKKVIANEGVDFRLRIRPLTAIAIAMGVAGVGFGLGRISVPPSSPVVKYFPQLAPNPWKETAFSGILRYTEANKRYYLVTNDSEAITLQAPDNVNVSKLINKRILAIGKYNTQTGAMVVSDASGLEILPANITPVPVLPAPSP